MNTTTPKTDAFLEELYTSGLPLAVKFAKLQIYAQKLERDRELCNDPDHGAINAERAEARSLRKAWVKLDDKRQILERKLASALSDVNLYKTYIAELQAQKKF